MKEISKSAAADLELVTEIRTKGGIASERAYSKLFKKYHKSMLFHFKGMVGGNEETAKDIVSEAFIKMNENLDRFDGDTAVFSTWLFSMTKNLFIDSLRKKKENVVSISDLATSDNEDNVIEFNLVSKDENVEDSIIRNERMKKLVAIVDSIENKEIVEIIKLRYFEGLSYEEIANITGKALNTVKISLFRGKDLLRKKAAEVEL